jgi:predicted NUDIX family phosphoesterase
MELNYNKIISFLDILDPKSNREKNINLCNSYIKNEDVLCVKYKKHPSHLYKKQIFEYIIFNKNYNIKENYNTFYCLEKHNRRECEYFNSEYLQIVSACIIYNNKEILLLENNIDKGFYKVGDLTYVQGHVTYPENENISFEDLIISNMKEEMKEEIIIDDIYLNNIKFINKCVYNDNPLSSIHHLYTMTSLYVEDLSIISSNEIQKHNVKIIQMKDLYKNINLLCPYIIRTLGDIPNLKNNFIEFLNNNIYKD